jgi:hypothetical protein
MAIETNSVDAEEDRPLAALADCKIDSAGGAWGQWDSDNLPALAHDSESSVYPFESECLDIGTGRLRDSQSVERKQREEGVLGGRSESGSHKESSDFVAVEPGGVRLVVEARPADMDRWRVIEKLLFDGIAVEAGDSAQAPGDSGASPAASFEVATEALDVGASRPEEVDAVLLAPRDELAKVQRVRLSGESAVVRPESRRAQAARHR